MSDEKQRQPTIEEELQELKRDILKQLIDSEQKAEHRDRVQIQMAIIAVGVAFVLSSIPPIREWVGIIIGILFIGIGCSGKAFDVLFKSGRGWEYKDKHDDKSA